ncbi:hypothetical protein [Bradyrhizobium canariense]
MVLKELRTALQWTDFDDRHPGVGRDPGEGFSLRASAAPTFTSSTANCLIPRCRLSRGTIAGRIDAIGAGVEGLRIGERVGIDFLRLAPKIGIVTSTTSYLLDQANQALADLRAGRFEGAAVLIP